LDSSYWDKVRNEIELGTAYHESGHAVASLRNGFVFEFVELVGLGDGHLFYVDETQEPLSLAAVCIAGPIASALHGKGPIATARTGFECDITSDDCTIAEWLKRNGPIHFPNDYQMTEAHLKKATGPKINGFIRTEISRVRSMWPAIESLAPVLLERRFLTYAECRAIVPPLQEAA